MAITQTTQFPSTPVMPGGSSITVTGNTGNELKTATLAVLATRQASQSAGSVVLDAAVAALNS